MVPGSAYPAFPYTMNMSTVCSNAVISYDLVDKVNCIHACRGGGGGRQGGGEGRGGKGRQGEGIGLPA